MDADADAAEVQLLAKDPVQQIDAWCRRAKTAGPPVYVVEDRGRAVEGAVVEGDGGSGGGGAASQQQQQQQQRWQRRAAQAAAEAATARFAAMLRVPGARDEETGALIDELTVTGAGDTAHAAKAAAAAAAISTLAATPLWARAMAGSVLEPAASLWGTVALALSPEGLSRDMELRNLVLLSQQQRAAQGDGGVGEVFGGDDGGGGIDGAGGGGVDGAGGACARLPLTALTRARLVARWFRRRAPRAVAGDHGAMLAELLRRRRTEPEGGDAALRDAGIVVIEEQEDDGEGGGGGGGDGFGMEGGFDGEGGGGGGAGARPPAAGAHVQLLRVHAPPAGFTAADDEGAVGAWAEAPVAVKVPADSAAPLEEISLDPSQGDLFGQVARALGAPGSSAAGRLVAWGRVGCRASWRAASGGESSAAAAAGRLVGQRSNRRPREQPDATAAAGAAAPPGGGGDGDSDARPAKRAAVARWDGMPMTRPPQPPPQQQQPPQQQPASGPASSGPATAAAASGVDLSTRSLAVEGAHGPAAMDWAQSSGGAGDEAAGGLGSGALTSGSRAGAAATLETRVSAATAASSAAAAGGGGSATAATTAAAGDIRQPEPALYSLYRAPPRGAAPGAAPAAPLNARASWLAGHPVYGDAVASLCRVSATEGGRPIVRWQPYAIGDFARSATALFPASAYVRARGLPVTTRLPRAFRSANSWQGPLPASLLSAYASHHAWRQRGGEAEVAYEFASTAAAPPPGADAAATAAAASQERWAARVAVTPFGGGGGGGALVADSGPEGFLDRRDAQQAAALAALHALEAADAAALASCGGGGGGAAAAAEWHGQVEVLQRPNTAAGRAPARGLVAKVLVRVALPQEASSTAAASEPSAGFVVEQRGPAPAQALSFELGAGAVVAPLEALVEALMPGGSGRVSAPVTVEGPDPLGVFEARPAVLEATLLALADPKPPVGAPAPARGAPRPEAARAGGAATAGAGPAAAAGAGGTGQPTSEPDPLAGLFDPPLRVQSAALIAGAARALGAASVAQLGGDSGELLSALLKGDDAAAAAAPGAGAGASASAPPQPSLLREFVAVDWLYGRLRRMRAALRAIAARSGGGGGGGGGGVAAAAPSPAPPLQRAASLLSGPATSAGGSGSFAGSTIGGPPQPLQQPQQASGAAAAANGEGESSVAPRAATAAAAAPPEAKATLLFGDPQAAPALAWSPAAWQAAAGAGAAFGGGRGVDLAVVTEALEMLAGGADEAADLVARRVLGALRPRAAIVVAPNCDYNPILGELAGDGALRGPAPPHGGPAPAAAGAPPPLRLARSRYEPRAAEFGAWAARAAAQAGGGYDCYTFGLGRARGDVGTQAAAAAAAASAGASALLQLKAAAMPANESVLRSVVAVARGALAAIAGPGAVEPLPGAGHALLVALWLRRDDAGTAAAVAGGDEEMAGAAAAVSAPSGERAVKVYAGPSTVVLGAPPAAAETEAGMQVG